MLMPGRMQTARRCRMLILQMLHRRPLSNRSSRRRRNHNSSRSGSSCSAIRRRRQCGCLAACCGTSAGRAARRTACPPDVEISGSAARLAARLSYTQKRLSPLLAAMSTSVGNTLLQLLRDPRFKPADAWTSMVAFLADINKDHVSDCCNHPL